MQNLYQNFTKIVPLDSVYSNMYSNVLEDVCKGNLAVSVENNEIYYRHKDFIKCDLLRIHQPISSSHWFGLMLAPDGPFFSAFNHK